MLEGRSRIEMLIQWPPMLEVRPWIESFVSSSQNRAMLWLSLVGTYWPLMASPYFIVSLSWSLKVVVLGLLKRPEGRVHEVNHFVSGLTYN